ncbi:hypothetical protein GPECTOR_33g652 [Gonium pectorale]|uniref:Uncharacterized protein n=1 Tax=Gonium pectorale TaxID=33097 RepID=A0A150GEJ4_GONPE|nr:hypothetical protein GPECTOR_33g652 [Gonium pectorale]|eukprot:KXZ47770.1 hypothetical protein GPECTOR_33g652 [Gonium pectorale]
MSHGCVRRVWRPRSGKDSTVRHDAEVGCQDELKASQETAQWTIKQNKNTLLGLKQENKELSAEVARRGGSNELQCKQGTATDGERVVERLERQVHELRRAYDKVIKDKKTALQKLDNLHDSLKDLAKVAAAALPPDAAAALPAAAAAALPPAGVSPVHASSHPSVHASGASSVALNASVSSAASSAIIAAAAASLPANSPAARELRQLQNRLDKATIKANEAYSIRKTYEQVLEKLRAEEPLLEGRIKALQEQRATKQSSLQAATISGREVAAAKEASRSALAAMEAEVAAGRARRAKVLAEMRDKAATLQQTNRVLLQKQFQPLTSSPTSAAASGAATPAGGAASASPPTAAAAAAAEASASELDEDITARDLIVRLCRITGVRRVSELLARLLAQQESYGRLVSMHSQAVAQKLSLVQELEVLRSHRDELRGGGKLSTQKQMDKAQEELRDATARADSASEGLDAAQRGWAQLRSGLEHLAAMVSPLPPPPGGPPNVPLEDETAVEVLAHIEQRLLGAYKLITSLPKAADMLESMYATLRHDS